MDFTEFNWDNLTNGSDPFASTKRTYENKVDTRFYHLPKDENGNGTALIRFLPDSENKLIQLAYKINTTITKNGKKRFVNEWSPMTMGKPCPFQEKWQELWNLGEKEEARNFSRTTRYIANIKVLKDPRNPENEGKIFLLDMSGELKTKVQLALQPTEDDIAMGEKPKQLFNPLKGNSFKLIARKGSNGIISYNDSKSVDEETSIYQTAEEAVADIKENSHKLSSFLQEDSYMSYAELADKLSWVTYADAPKSITTEAEPASETPVTTPEEPKQAPVQTPVAKASSSDDLDALLNELM